MNLINKSVYLEKERILVITDLHIGYEEGVNLGIREQYNLIIRDLTKIFEEIELLKHKSEALGNRGASKKIDKNHEEDCCQNALDRDLINRDSKLLEKIVILGDLKHRIGGISGQEWKETRELLILLRKKAKKIVLIKGNHDKIIEPLVGEEGVQLVDYYIEGEYGFIHGDKEIFIDKVDILKNKQIKTIFIGHFHPAIRLEEGAKREIYKCFLVGKYRSKKIIILPSFFPLVEGSDVLKEETNLAYDFNLGNFEVYIPEEVKVLNFGKLKNVGRLN